MRANVTVIKNRLTATFVLRLLSCLLIGCNLHYVWSVPVFPTLDGPAHLYNSSLLGKLAHSSFLREYLEFNEWFLPNYLPHYLLMGLQEIVSPFAAEKILVSMILLFLPLSFHRLCKVWDGDPDAGLFMNVLAVSSFLYLGFYNFLAGFIFVNIQMVLIRRYLTADEIPPGTYLLMIANVFGCYYTHPFSFGILCLLSIFIFLFCNPRPLRHSYNRLLLLGLALLPCFIFFLLFRMQVHVPDYSYSVPNRGVWEKFTSLTHFSLGVVYVDETESQVARIFPLVLLLLTLYKMLFEIQKPSPFANLLLTLTIVSFVLFFVLPDGILGGMFGLRMTFLSAFFWCAWLVVQKFKRRWVPALAGVIVTVAHIGCLELRAPFLGQLSRSAVQVVKTSPYLPPRARVYSVNLSPLVTEAHFSNYAGIGKEVVISENYEATLRWFPLRWKREHALFTYKIDPAKPDFIPATHILLIGDTSKLSEEANTDLKYFIADSCSLVFRSERGFSSLFRINR